MAVPQYGDYGSPRDPNNMLRERISARLLVSPRWARGQPCGLLMLPGTRPLLERQFPLLV
jgi:hypothetical protein